MNVFEYWLIERDFVESIALTTANPYKRRYYESRQEAAEQEIERMLRA